jgi:2-hydroxychromene-2-carboxylate isomerase
MTKPIQFLFDYVSPYAYLASTQVRALAARHGREVYPVPVLFGGMLAATGARGPAEIPAKRDYLFRDVVRLARALDVPIEPPATHPFNPLTALRATSCLEPGATRWHLVDALFRAAWVLSCRVDDEGSVARVAREAGLDGAALVAQASSDEVKARLRTATDEALSAGVFGVPTMLVDGELFWGVDSLPLLDRFLRGDDARDDDQIERWRRVAPSAVRRALRPLPADASAADAAAVRPEIGGERR